MNNFTSNNNINTNTLLLSSSNNISSLSKVDVKKNNVRKAKIFLISMFLIAIITLALITSIIVVLIKTNQTQLSLNNMQNSIKAMDVQINELEKSLDKKYSKLDSYDFDQEKELDIKYGKAVILNSEIVNDESIVLNNSQNEISSFMSVIINNLQKFWSFLN